MLDTTFHFVFIAKNIYINSKNKFPSALTTYMKYTPQSGTCSLLMLTLPGFNYMFHSMSKDPVLILICVLPIVRSYGEFTRL